MKSFKNFGILFLVFVIAMSLLTGCTNTNTTASQQARQDAMGVANRLVELQPMPTDIQASLERHNIIRRSYWINGMRERAMSLPNPITNPPLGYIILFAPNGGVVGRFMVEGKVTSLNYSLVPYSEYYELNGGQSTHHRNRWIANAGGVYGTNTNGVFWFTPDGKYMEWNGTYLFSDIPFIIDDPVLRIGGVDNE
jgi:hypothetical protein